jgi:8-amino-7-oxononanoate synthase
MLNFSSNDYLGLANHPALREASIKAVELYGAGSGASRLICGSLRPHIELEEALAQFKGAEAAITFSSGFAAALGTIGALLEKDDILVLDKRVHACIVDAARLCGARLRVFKHNDINDLEKILQWAVCQRQMASSKTTRILIVTESVFSMDGDRAPLGQLVDLKERYGAWLMVDEAHACGLFGPHRSGMADHLNLAERIEIQMGTLGKAIGSCGGFICGAAPLIDFLINRARSFIFSTAPTPSAAAAAAAGVRLIQSSQGECLCRQLWKNAAYLIQNARFLTSSNGESHVGKSSPSPLTSPPVEGDVPVSEPQSPIIPWMIGDEGEAMRIARVLFNRGFFVPAIRYPTVARGAARLRITLSAAHTEADLERFIAAIDDLTSSLC